MSLVVVRVSHPSRQRLDHQRAYGVQGLRAVLGDQADAGAAVQEVGLVEGALVPQGPEDLGPGDGVVRQDPLAEPGAGASVP